MIHFLKFSSESRTLALSMKSGGGLSASSPIFAPRNDDVWRLFKKQIPKNRWKDVKHQWRLQGYARTGPLTNRHVDIALNVLKTVNYQDDIKDYTESYKESKKLPSAASRSQFHGLLRDHLGSVQDRFEFIHQAFNLEGNIYFEYLSKYIGARWLDKNLVIPGPLINGTQTYYYVNKTIFQDGMLAYALVSTTDQPSILLFAPTETSLLHPYFVDSLASDFDPIGIGAQTFQKNARRLKKLLRDEKFSKNGVIVSGFSLGGVFAQRFTAHDSNYKYVKKVYCFNSPAIDANTVEEYQKKVGNHGPEIIYVRAAKTLNSTGDFCDHVGDVYLHSKENKGKIIFCHWPEGSSPWDRHTSWSLNNQTVVKTELEINSTEGKKELHQESRGPKVRSYEALRLNVSRCAKPVFALIGVMRSSLYKKTLKHYSAKPKKHAPPCTEESSEKYRSFDQVYHFFKTRVHSMTNFFCGLTIPAYWKSGKFSR